MLANLTLTPGVILDETTSSNEGGFVGGDRIRFKNGRLSAIGGWTPRTAQKVPGIVRGAHDWSADRLRLLAYGTESALWVLYGGALLNITPNLTEGVITQPFSLTAGSPLVTVKHPRHGFVGGDIVVFSNCSLVGGVNFDGAWPIGTLTKDSYTVQLGAPATGTATSLATDTADYISALPVGNTDGAAFGWGTRGWNEGAWGGSQGSGSDAGDAQPRIWSFDNMGPRLVANPRGRGVYEWEPVIGPPETVLDGIFSNAPMWVLGAGWALTGGQAVATAGAVSAIGQLAVERLEPGNMYRMTADITVSAGSVQFMNGDLSNPAFPAAVAVGEASTPITRSGSYSRLFRAASGLTHIGFLKDAGFAGTIDNLSIRQESKAYQVKGAPRHVDWIFADPVRCLIALACEGFDGVHNTMLVRWSALDNIEDWVPLDTNLAGELPLAGGTRLMSGCNIRQANILLSETTAFRLQFIGGSTGFAQQVIGTGCGTISRNGLVEWNGAAYWLSSSGFYQYTGGTVQKIPCPVELYVLNDLAPLQDEKIYGGINPLFNEIWWLYAAARDGKECSRAVVYNFAEKVWTVHTIPRTCWVSTGLFLNPIAFAPDGNMFEQETGTSANGSPINWWAETAPVDVEDGENLETITGLMPDVKNQIGSVTYEVSCRLQPQGPYLPTDTRIAAPGQPWLRFRRKGRQVRLRISSLAQESAFHIGTPKIDLAKAEAKQ